MGQIGSFPQIGINIKNLWNHHLVMYIQDCYMIHPETAYKWCTSSGRKWSSNRRNLKDMFTWFFFKCDFLHSSHQKTFESPTKKTGFQRLILNGFNGDGRVGLTPNWGTWYPTTKGRNRDNIRAEGWRSKKNTNLQKQSGKIIYPIESMYVIFTYVRSGRSTPIISI